MVYKPSRTVFRIRVMDDDDEDSGCIIVGFVREVRNPGMCWSGVGDGDEDVSMAVDSGVKRGSGARLAAVKPEPVAKKAAARVTAVRAPWC